MKGVTMSVGTPVTVAVILYLGTMVEATYLERPLWVADKGRQQPVAYVNEDSRFGQFPAANEQAWMIPEPYAPQRTGPSNTEWVEDQPRQSPNVPQTVPEERLPLESLVPNQGYDRWNSPDTAYEYQTKYQAQSLTNGQSQSAWLSQQPPPQQQLPEQYQPPQEQSPQQQQQSPQQYKPPQQQQLPQQYQPPQQQQQYQPPQQQQQYQPPQQKPSHQEQQRPQQYQPPQQKPLEQQSPQQYQPPQQQQQYQPPQQQQQYQPPQQKPSHQEQQTPQQYQPPQQKPLEQQSPQKYQPPQEQYQPSPQRYQPSQQQVEYQKPFLTLEPSNLQSQPEPEYYNPYVQPGWNRDPKPENSQSNYYQPEHQTQDKYQPNKMDFYKPKPDADKQLSSNQPKPETFKPNQANVEPFPSNTETMKPNYTPKRPQEVPQSYNPYPARPELYKPGPSFVEPEYQMPHYGQQALPGYTDLEMQVSTNKRPKPQTSKPVEQPNKVRKPQPDNELGQAPLLNSGYNPYQSQESWLPYQQNPTEGLQVPSVPDVNVGDSMSVYPMPSLQGSYGREPIVEKPKPVDRVTQQQENHKPLQPPKIEQQPNRPMQQAPEQPSYQPNRMPSTTWDTQYMPKPVPEMPKPKPQPRPPMVEPTYNRRPEVYYGGNDDEDDGAVVKYAQSITRVDNRCPLEDNPAKPVHFPSLTSCVKFQKCFNGVAYEMSCPGGLEFDAKNNRCDYPARARCSV